jgi:hypothetical protein
MNHDGIPKLRNKVEKRRKIRNLERICRIGINPQNGDRIIQKMACLEKRAIPTEGDYKVDVANGLREMISHDELPVREPSLHNAPAMVYGVLVDPTSVV